MCMHPALRMHAYRYKQPTVQSHNLSCACRNEGYSLPVNSSASATTKAWSDQCAKEVVQATRSRPLARRARATSTEISAATAAANCAGAASITCGRPGSNGHPQRICG